MDCYAGIDVSLGQSSVCVADSLGRIVRETKVASEPEALQQHFADLGLPVVRVGLDCEGFPPESHPYGRCVRSHPGVRLASRSPSRPAVWRY